MIEPASQHESPPGRASAALCFLEVLLIVLVFFAAGGEPPPHDNEAHYLCRLKHYWNPEWCTGDLFLDSADAQLVFIWTFGWVTRWLSLPATAWVGRFVAWTLLAWAWQRLSWRVAPRSLASVLSAALFVTLNDVFHLAGEWIVGGVEAKCFAYVFVVLALCDVLDARWNRVWLLLGAAAAFHPVVGGWSVIICGGIWLLLIFSKNERDRRQSFASMLPGLAAGGLLALFGVLPALRLTWNAPADVVAEAGRIYVFDRLPHHLALLSLPTAEIWQRVSRHALLLFGLWLLSRSITQPTQVARRNSPEFSVDSSALQKLVRFAWGAALLAVLGFAIEFALRGEPLVAARLLRYYWFRMTDFAAPLAASLIATALVVAGLQSRRKLGLYGLFAAIAIAGGHLADKAFERLAIAVPPSDRKMADFAAWVDVCQWVAENTEADARFLTPRMNQSFKWRTGRAEVATRKDIPQDAASIVEWNTRYRHIYYEDASGGPLVEPTSLGRLGTERVKQLANEYGATYIITSRGTPLWLPVVYPNARHGNEEYVVYRIDGRNEQSRNVDNGK